MKQAIIITMLTVLSILGACHALISHPTSQAQQAQTESPMILKPLVVIYVF